jgi:hypothetical protein
MVILVETFRWCSKLHFSLKKVFCSKLTLAAIKMKAEIRGFVESQPILYSTKNCATFSVALSAINENL